MADANQVVNWGILGCARIARLQVVPALLRCKNAHLAAVASRDSKKLDEFHQLFGNFTDYLTYEALLDDPKIDAVYIPLPNSMHCQWAKLAMQKGKHVLCEKPLALNARQAEEMINTARETGKLLMEAFMYRYTDRTRKIEEVLASGVLGKIKAVNSTFRFFLDRAHTIKENPELGGGAMYDVGCYPLNFSSLVSKAEPTSISVQSEQANGVDINTSAILKYDDGMIASLHCGFNAFGRMHSEVIGTEGILLAPDTFLDDAGELLLQTKTGTQPILVEKSDRYAEQIRDFSAAILEQRQPKLSLTESLQNMRILEKILNMIKRSA